MRIPYAYISSCPENIRALSIFLFMKRCFVNSCFYGWSVSYVARKANMSKASVRKWVDLFLSRGWAYVRGGDLYFRSTRKLFGETGRGACMAPGLSWRDIEHKIRLHLLSVSVKGFEWLRDASKNLRKKGGESRRKLRLSKLFTKHNYRDVDVAQEHYKISYKGLSGKFGVSPSSAYRIMRKMQEKGDIVIFTKVVEVKGMAGAWKHLKQESLKKGDFWKGRRLLRRSCNQYKIVNQS